MDFPSQSPQSDRAVLRAADEDRERVATLLRDHFSEGRLTEDEFQERLEAAYAARTLGQLDTLTRDLPARTPTPVPAPSEAPSPRSQGFRAHLTAYLLVNLFLIAIWAVTDFGGYFWPIWPILGWGLGLAAHALGADVMHGPGRRRGSRQRREARQAERRRSRR